MGGYVRKKICSAPGCNKYALSNSAYCEEHQKTVSRDTTSKFKEFYHSTYWKKARRLFLLNHNWCEECLKQGRFTLSKVVHHSKGFGDWQSFCDKSKWVALCESCHSKIHTQVTNEDLWNRSK